MKQKFIFFSVFIFSLLISCRQPGLFIDQPSAVNGIINLKDWNFSTNGPVTLDGEWEFYWKQFVSGEDLRNKKLENNVYITVPGVWKGVVLNGSRLPGLGYATYRIRILNNSNPKSLALKLPTISTAYKLYLNGTIISSAGVIGENKDTSTPEAITQIINLELKPESNELVFQISNFDYAKGGLWYSLLLGQKEDITKIRESDFFRDLFLLGSIFIIGIYHIIIFFLRKKELAALSFGLFCLLISLRILTTGQLFINNLFPFLPWSILVRLEFLSFYLSVPVYLTFMKYLFPKDISKMFIKIFRFTSMVFILLVIITPVKIFTGSVQYFQILTVLGAVYIVYLHILTIYRKRPQSGILFIGFIIIFLVLINDILFQYGFVSTGELFPYGLLVLIVIQAYTLANRFLDSFRAVEILSEEISIAEEKYRSIFENSMEGIYRSNINGSFVIVNQAFARITGYDSPEEVLGKSNINSWYVDKTERERLVEILKDNKYFKNNETKIYRKDSRIIDIRENAYAVYDRAGQIKYIEGNIIDITELRQVERLRLEREVAEASNRTKSDFLANMSHEIRTPLNAIMGFTDVLLDSEDEPLKKEQLDIIKTAGVNLLNLINDILDFSRLEAGQVKIEMGKFSIKGLFEYLENLFKLKSNELGLDFTISLITAVPEFLLGDEHRISQILINIIGNALKFTKKGSVKVRFSYQEGMAVIYVEDTGIGISLENQDIIFSSFSQADMSISREFGGTGLGLAISRNLAELMGGTLGLESTSGKGSTFVLTLPLSPA